ncbi:MAG: hypothetical protein HY083_04840, partial [Gammaproteobacteria bacterium]|nr:hypothetical protein [Gammaproteobacteria bacterium]
RGITPSLEGGGTTTGKWEVEQRTEHDYREGGGRVTPGAVTELPSAAEEPKP